MTEYEKMITRRDFIRGTACATLTLTMGIGVEGQEKKAPVKLTKVVLIRDKNVFDKEGGFNAEVMQQMLDDAVVSLFGAKKPAEARATSGDRFRPLMYWNRP